MHKRIVLVVAATMMMLSPVIVPAAAIEVDFDVKLTTIDGKPFTGPDGKETETTLASICQNALLAGYPDEQNLSGIEKVARYGMALKIRDEKKWDLTATEVELLKKLVAKAFPPLIVGQVWAILDPASVKAK